MLRFWRFQFVAITNSIRWELNSLRNRLRNHLFIVKLSKIIFLGLPTLGFVERITFSSASAFFFNVSRPHTQLPPQGGFSLACICVVARFLTKKGFPAGSSQMRPHAAIQRRNHGETLANRIRVLKSIANHLPLWPARWKLCPSVWTASPPALCGIGVASAGRPIFLRI